MASRARKRENREPSCRPGRLVPRAAHSAHAAHSHTCHSYIQLLSRMGPQTVAAVLQVAAAAAVLPSRSQASQPLAPPTDVQAELKKLENQKRNGHAAWSTFVSKLITTAAGQQAVLECTQCKAQLSTSNLSQLCGKHFKMHQKKSVQTAAAVMAASEAGETFGNETASAKSARAQRVASRQRLHEHGIVRGIGNTDRRLLVQLVHVFLHSQHTAAPYREHVAREGMQGHRR